MNKAAQIFLISIVFLLCHEAAAAQTESREATDASFKLARGGKVSISNRTGSVTVQGWDRDTVEARAVDVDTSERAPIQAIEATPYFWAKSSRPLQKSSELRACGVPCEAASNLW